MPALSAVRTAYRSEKFSELCAVCRKPTDHGCFSCGVPLCKEHAHLRCLACEETACAACERCGHGVCTKHRPIKRNHRCPTCEKELWDWAGRVSSTNAPARATDLLAVSSLFAGTIWAIPNGALALVFASGAFAWPAGKMILLAAKRRAKAEQLRPDFIKQRTASRATCS